MDKGLAEHLGPQVTESLLSGLTVVEIAQDRVPEGTWTP